MRKFVSAWMIAFLSIVVVAQGPAQLGTVTGMVRDREGSAIPGVTVTARGRGVTALTDENGAYTLRLPEGNHVVTAALPGFAPVEITVSVQAGQIAQAPLQMQVQSPPPRINILPPPRLTPFEDYRITADSQSTTGSVTTYRGNVLMITNTTDLRADELDFNTATLTAEVRGNVSVRVVPARARIIPLGH